MFQFEPRWKEQMVVTGPGGWFLLEFVVGPYLPTEAIWREKAPDWARDLWPDLKAELETWCQQKRHPLFVDETAWVDPLKSPDEGRII